MLDLTSHQSTTATIILRRRAPPIKERARRKSLLWRRRMKGKMETRKMAVKRRRIVISISSKGFRVSCPRRFCLVRGATHILTPGKHSMRKDDYLTTIMQIPPKQRVAITPFDQKTQREAFSVSLEGLKGVGVAPSPCHIISFWLLSGIQIHWSSNQHKHGRTGRNGRSLRSSQKRMLPGLSARLLRYHPPLRRLLLQHLGQVPGSLPVPN